MLSSKDFLRKRFNNTDVFECADIHRAQKDSWWKDRSQSEVSSLKLPYYAPGHHDPPIPTAYDVVGPQATALDANRGVYRVFGKYVVKRLGSLYLLLDAESHIFLERHSKARIPKVYAVFSHLEKESSGTEKNFSSKEQAPVPTPSYYLVTEYIEGLQLFPETFKALDISLQEKIGHAIGTQLKALTNVPGEGYYGRVNNQAWLPTNYLLDNPNLGEPRQYGPYTSYEEFVNDWYDTALYRAAVNHFVPPDDYTKKQLAILRNFKYIMHSVAESQRTPTLCHRDVAWGNIIFKEIVGIDGKVCDYEATLIDFESLCWLPKWMESGMLSEFSWPDYEHMYLEAVKCLEPLNLPMGRWFNRELLENVLGVW
ncbi:hypothetical protein P154DRAFT_583334 [Amniculicola lignicola CBS 123094]|uniref:Aminoglycoside phosphotransferase domain-containing protein n=1 Tax=Amniculicola lignicola CBS 123094 TaxID=1392246 RepID=A0A6A5VTS3_9PLEO|nr:hypothetical protein P154DRAFT_583334 [Amniculicola lignicola CBS 123094]